METKASAAKPDPLSFLSKHFRQDVAASKGNDKAKPVTGPFQRPSSGTIPKFQFGKTKAPPLNFQLPPQPSSLKSHEPSMAPSSTRSQVVTLPNGDFVHVEGPCENLTKDAVHSYNVVTSKEGENPPVDHQNAHRLPTHQKTSIPERSQKAGAFNCYGDVSRQERPASLHSSGAQLDVPPGAAGKSMERRTNVSSQQRLLDYVGQLQRDLDNAESIIKDSHVEWSKKATCLQEEVDATKSQLKSERNTVLTQSKRLSEYDEEVKTLRSNVQSYRNKLDELQYASVQSKTVFDSMRAEYQNILKNQEELVIDQDATLDALTKATRQQESLRKQLTELKTKIGIVESANANRLQDLQGQKDDLASALAEQRNDNMRLQQHLLESSKSLNSALIGAINDQIAPLTKSFLEKMDDLESSLTKTEPEWVRETFKGVEGLVKQQVEHLACSVSAMKKDLCDQLDRRPTELDMLQFIKVCHSEQTASLTTEIKALFEDVKTSWKVEEERTSVACLEKNETRLLTEKSELESQLEEMISAHDILASEKTHLEEVLHKERAKCRLLEFDVERHLSKTTDQSQTLHGLRQLVSALQIQLEESNQTSWTRIADNVHLIADCGSQKGCKGPDGICTHIGVLRRATDVSTPEYEKPTHVRTPPSRQREFKSIRNDCTKRLEFKATTSITESGTPSVSSSFSSDIEMFPQNNSPLVGAPNH